MNSATGTWPARPASLGLNHPVDGAAEFSGGEGLGGFSIQFRKARQQPRLRLAEAQPSDGNGRRFQLRLMADRVARVPGVLVGRLSVVAVMERHEYFARPDG